MKNPIHIFNRLISLPLLLVVGIYFFSPSISLPSKENSKSKFALAKTNKQATKSSKAELNTAFVAVVQVFHSFFQPLTVACFFVLILTGLLVIEVQNEIFPKIRYFRHLFTHVISTNAP